MFFESENASIYLPIVQTLIGGGLALVGSLAGIYLTQLAQRRTERENLRSALRGEIAAIRTIVKSRGYIEGIRENLEDLKKGEDTDLYSFSVTFEAAPVFRSNVGKIGLLKADLAEKVATFYTFMFAALADFESIDRGEWDGIDLDEKVRRMTELLQIVEMCWTISEDIINNKG